MKTLRLLPVFKDELREAAIAASNWALRPLDLERDCAFLPPGGAGRTFGFSSAWPQLPAFLLPFVLKAGGCGETCWDLLGRGLEKGACELERWHVMGRQGKAAQFSQARRG